MDHDCELCRPAAEPVWEDERCRVISVPDADYPGFCRVIWKRHTGEMTDLPASDRRHLMDVVWAVEAALRQLQKPDKINLASFGNMVPHLHWHVIPRWRDDRHFPQSVWGEAQRPGKARPAPAAADLHRAITAWLASDSGGMG